LFKIIYINNNNIMIGKVIIIGDSGVGKTTILTQFIHERYKNDHDLTIGVDFGSKYVNINNAEVRLQIWDTAGQECFRSISRSYYKDAKVAIIVFDAANNKYKEQLNSWINDINMHNNNVKIIIVCNKKDKLSKFQQTNISKKIKECYSNQFYLISSKIFSDVEKVFINAAEIIYEDLQHIEEHHQQNNIISFEKPSVWNNIKIKVKTCF